MCSECACARVCLFVFVFGLFVCFLVGYLFICLFTCFVLLLLFLRGCYCFVFVFGVGFFGGIMGFLMWQNNCNQCKFHVARSNELTGCTLVYPGKRVTRYNIICKYIKLHTSLCLIRQHVAFIVDDCCCCCGGGGLAVSVITESLLTVLLFLSSGAGRSSEVERSLMVRWVVGSILHGH